MNYEWLRLNVDLVQSDQMYKSNQLELRIDNENENENVITMSTHNIIY